MSDDDLYQFYRDRKVTKISELMDLLDKFAMAALPALLHASSDDDKGWDLTDIERTAYGFAIDMIMERKEAQNELIDRMMAERKKARNEEPGQ